MDFQPIFGSDPECEIWAVINSQKKVNSFKEFIDKLRDDSYVFNFLHEREQFINREFWGGIEVDRLFNLIKLETRQIIKDVANVVNEGSSQNISLKELFVPLIKNEYSMNHFYRHTRKAKFYTTHRQPPLLRLYGIELSDGTIVVTGGAIKLFKKMKEDSALLDELKKIDKVQNYINDNRIVDKRGLI